MTDEPSSIPGFVAELFRAANEIERVSAFEQKRLAARAERTIRDLRDELNSEVPDANPVRDQLLNDLRAVADRQEEPVPAVVAAALLPAAEDIRALHVVLRNKGRIVAKAGQREARQP